MDLREPVPDEMRLRLHLRLDSNPSACPREADRPIRVAPSLPLARWTKVPSATGVAAAVAVVL